MISFLSLQIETVAAIHHIVLLVLETFEVAEEKCWIKLSKGLQWNTLSSFTQERYSHHIGIVLPQVKNRWLVCDVDVDFGDFGIFVPITGLVMVTLGLMTI